MKLKRVTLIVCLIIYSLVCFQMMNTKYDPLARYQYTTVENRDVIVDNMSQDDINYIIEQKIKPEQFMDFITLDGFVAKNILFYDTCKKAGVTDNNYIIWFVNKFRDKFELATFENLVFAYGCNMLGAFYEGGYPYLEDVTLETNPAAIDTVIKSDETLYKYVPTNLVAIDNSVVPYIASGASDVIYIKAEMVEDLRKMCTALASTNNKTAGGLILTSGYVSYSEQVALYENAIVKHGIDHFQKFEDYPGQSIKQLGYTVSFTIAGLDEKQILASDQVKWLHANAKTYGFELCYPEGKENETGKAYQPLTFKYVGKDE